MLKLKTSFFMYLCFFMVFAFGWSQNSSFADFISFDGQAEGVTVDEIGNVYVSVRASTDQIWKLSPGGVKTLLADLGEPGGGVCGLAVDTVGNVYAAQAHESGRVIDPNLDNPGVYRIDPNGDVVLLPGTGQIVFPNGLAFDHRGTLYVTESYSIESSSGDFGPGGIWRIPKGGTAELWLRDKLLTGLPPSLFPFPVGANGIGFYHGDLYMINTDKALVVRVRVRPDGSPGQPEVWKEVEDVPESVFYNSTDFPVMLDGLAFDVHGNIYITVISRMAVVRINADDLSQETIAVYPEIPLDSPASLAFGTGKGGRQNLFVTNLGIMGGFVPEMEWPGPGLVKLERRCAWFAAAMNMR